MVIVRLLGGLGNQLFQYAAARRLSILHQTSLKLDISFFASQSLRRYGLGPFCIQEQLAEPEEIALVRGLSGNWSNRICSRLNRRFTPFYRPHVYAEWRLGPFSSDILRTSKDVYLDGYWQSEKYFADVGDVVKREFVIKYEQDHRSREVGEEIRNAQSVCIHVRRGDYLSESTTNQVHGVCGLDYYDRCVRFLAERIPNPQFFVFSDDIGWTRQNLHLEYSTTFVDHNGATREYEDLRLMSMCKHNIIANSSFSWWGAWLNTNPGKMVLAPRRWFNDPSLDTRDLLPDSWMKL